jgi:hypothetical protein
MPLPGYQIARPNRPWRARWAMRWKPVSNAFAITIEGRIVSFPQPPTDARSVTPFFGLSRVSAKVALTGARSSRGRLGTDQPWWQRSPPGDL